MNMKKIILSVLAVVMLSSFVYAQQDPGQNVRIVILPDQTTDFLKKYFKKDSIDYASMNNIDYVITLKSGTVVTFSKDGSWKSVDGNFKPIETKYIDNKIMKLVKQQHPKAKVLKASRTYGGYDIVLDNRMTLVFDSNGILLRQDTAAN